MISSGMEFIGEFISKPFKRNAQEFITRFFDFLLL